MGASLISIAFGFAVGAYLGFSDGSKKGYYRGFDDASRAARTVYRKLIWNSGRFDNVDENEKEQTAERLKTIIWSEYRGK